MDKSESIIPKAIEQSTTQEKYINTVARIDDLRGQLYDTLTFKERDNLPEDTKNDIRKQLSEQRRILDSLFPTIIDYEDYKILLAKMLAQITPKYRDLL